MSEIQVGQINSTDGSTAITTGADGYVSFAKTQIGGRRNLIINGGQVIDQRHGGASVNGSDGQYVTDRFKADSSQAPKFTAQQVTDAPTGFSNSLKITSSSAYTPASGDFFDIQHKIEGYSTSPLNLGTANAEAITLSFYVKSSLTGTFGGSIANSAYNRGYPFTYTISSADTWERKTITLTGDTTGTWIGATNGIGLRLHWSIGIGTTYAGTAGAWAAGLLLGATGQTNVVATSGATWQITGVQLEVGTVATPFEHRSYGEELALCQRYYQVVASGATETIGTGYFESSTVAVCPTRFMTTMRASPTLYSGTGTDYYYIYSAGSGVDSFNNLIGTAIGVSGATVYTTSNVSGTAGQAGRMVTAASGGYVAFGAEL